MGYSVFVRANSENQAKELYKLLIRKCKKGDYYRICYGNKKHGISYNGLIKPECSVGFDYSCMSDKERNYIYGIIKWLAGKIGKNFYYYDGDEKVKIL